MALEVDITKKLDGFFMHMQFRAEQEIFAILGASGCGKSMTLKCIAGIEKPDEGRIVLDGKVLFDSEKKINLPPQKRKVGYMFQDYALFPHMNVVQNIEAGMGKRPDRSRTESLIRQFQLEGLEKKIPGQLSGGQKQRIAIARALATNPKVLLCDEATSALDPNTTHAILTLIKDINKKLGITVVVITHQMSVVEEICDSVAILDGGVVVEQGEVREIFANPKTAAARRLVAPNGGSAARDLSSFAPDDHVVRVTFNGSSAAKPLVASLAAEKGILVSVLSADTRDLSGQCYGSMLLKLPRDTEQAKQAAAYMRSQNGVTVEEVTGE